MLVSRHFYEDVRSVLERRSKTLYGDGGTVKAIVCRVSYSRLLMERARINTHEDSDDRLFGIGLVTKRRKIAFTRDDKSRLARLATKLNRKNIRKRLMLCPDDLQKAQLESPDEADDIVRACIKANGTVDSIAMIPHYKKLEATACAVEKEYVASQMMPLLEEVNAAFASSGYDMLRFVATGSDSVCSMETDAMSSATLCLIGQSGYKSLHDHVSKYITMECGNNVQRVVEIPRRKKIPIERMQQAFRIAVEAIGDNKMRYGSSVALYTLLQDSLLNHGKFYGKKLSYSEWSERLSSLFDQQFIASLERALEYQHGNCGNIAIALRWTLPPAVTPYEFDPQDRAEALGLIQSEIPTDSTNSINWPSAIIGGRFVHFFHSRK